MTSLTDAPTLAQVLARQGALAPDATLLVLIDVTDAAAARESAAPPVGPVTADMVRVTRTGQARLMDAPGSAGEVATGAVVELGGVFAAPATPVVPSLARLGVAMLEGDASGSSDRAAVPSSVRGAAMRVAFTRALERGLAGDVQTAASFAALLREVPLRPSERKTATDQIARMASRAASVTDRPIPAVRRPYPTRHSGGAASAILRKTLIGALVLAVGAAWLERDRLFSAPAEDDNGAVTRVLVKRSNRLRAAGSSVEDSAAIEAARLAGASRSGSSGGEAEASVANDPLVEGIAALEAGRTRDAVPLLQAATARGSRKVDARGYLACAYRRLGRHDEADQALAGTRGAPGPWTGCARQRPDSP